MVTYPSPSLSKTVFTLGNSLPFTSVPITLFQFLASISSYIYYLWHISGKTVVHCGSFTTDIEEFMVAIRLVSISIVVFWDRSKMMSPSGII